MDTPTVKNILGITTTRHDTYLDTVVPLFKETIQSYCGQTFKNDAGEVILPGPVQIALAKWVEYNMHRAGVTGASESGVSYSYDTDIPQHIKTLLRPHRKLGWS